MSYYQGDWYRGDFYRGDPGFWSAITGIGKAALGFLPGGSVAQGALGAVTSLVHKPVAGSGGKVSAITSLGSKALAAVKGHPVLSAAGAAGAIAGGSMLMGPGRGAMTTMAGGARQKGMHMSKPRKGVAPHLVRNRRMNVCNPRALRRAIRRSHGFAKLAMKTIHITHPKKKGRFGGFKRRVRRG